MSQNPTTQNPYNGLNLVQVLSTMVALMAEETLNHFRMGLLYIYVVDSNLLDGTKYKSPLDFFTSNIQDVSRSALALYGAVARAFNEEVCKQFGMSRLSLLLTYKKAAKIELNPDAPGDTSILVPDTGGGVKPKRFADATADELRQAVSHLRSPTPSQPIPHEHRALYDGYLQAVTSHFSKSSLARVLMRTQEGKTRIIFDVLIEEVPKLSEALASQLDLMGELSEEAGVEEVMTESVPPMSQTS